MESPHHGISLVSRMLERPQAVAHDRHRRGGRDDEAEVLDRVEGERRPHPGVGAGDQLPVALARDEEERAERGHGEEPVRQHDPRRHAAGRGAHREAARHDHDVDGRRVLEAERVRNGDELVGGQQQPEAPGDRVGEPEPSGEAHDDGRKAGAHGHDPGRDRALALDGMAAVGLRVGDVVEQVRRRGHEHEGDEGQAGEQQRAAVVERTARRRRREDQQVLDPLARPRRADEAADGVAARGRPRLGLRPGRGCRSRRAHGARRLPRGHDATTVNASRSISREGEQ